jgi:hypothetical protein
MVPERLDTSDLSSGKSVFKAFFPLQNRMKGEQHRLSPLSLSALVIFLRYNVIVKLSTFFQM